MNVLEWFKENYLPVYDANKVVFYTYPFLMGWFAADLVRGMF